MSSKPDQLMPVAGRVSLVVLTFNRWDCTRRFLDSLLEDPESCRRIELVWLDNASSDGTVPNMDQWLADAGHVFAGIVSIINPANTGFIRGVNRAVLAASGEYVCLLNNDTTVPKGWLDGLLTPLTNDDGIGAIGPVSDGMPWNQSHERAGQGMKPAPVVYGFCLLTRRTTLDAVGLLDERYGRGVAEVEDWCERVTRLGYRFAVNTDVLVTHNEPHASYTPRTNAMLHIRNRGYFTEKWGFGPHYWGDRTRAPRRFGRTDVHTAEAQNGAVAWSSVLESTGPEVESLWLTTHDEHREHLEWLTTARTDPRLNVVCLPRLPESENDLRLVLRANARSDSERWQLT